MATLKAWAVFISCMAAAGVLFLNGQTQTSPDVVFHYPRARLLQQAATPLAPAAKAPAAKVR